MPSGLPTEETSDLAGAERYECTVFEELGATSIGRVSICDAAGAKLQ